MAPIQLAIITYTCIDCSYVRKATNDIKKDSDYKNMRGIALLFKRILKSGRMIEFPYAR